MINRLIPCKRSGMTVKKREIGIPAMTEKRGGVNDCPSALQRVKASAVTGPLKRCDAAGLRRGSRIRLARIALIVSARRHGIAIYDQGTSGAEFGQVLRADGRFVEENAILTGSAMEWLIRFRGFPVLMLKESYRCQNPRLLRFASILFYNAEVRPAAHAEYYRLSYPERMRRYAPETLCFYSTSGLPPERKHETLSLDGRKPGLSNPAEAQVCVHLFYRMLRKHPLREITIIAPYRRQVRVIRGMLNLERARREKEGIKEEAGEWYTLDFVDGEIVKVGIEEDNMGTFANYPLFKTPKHLKKAMDCVKQMMKL